MSRSLVPGNTVSVGFSCSHMKNYKETPYLQIEKLRDLFKSPNRHSKSAHLNEIGQNADLVIGRSW